MHLPVDIPLLPYYHLPTQQPHAAAAPYISIDPILGRGSSVVVPTTVNIPNGRNLLLNASSKLSDITTNTPWLSITMDSADNNHQCISIQYLSRRGVSNIMNWGGGLVTQQYFFFYNSMFFGSVGGVWYGVISHPETYTITNYA